MTGVNTSCWNPSYKLAWDSAHGPKFFVACLANEHRHSTRLASRFRVLDARCATRYTSTVIKSFRHKGLRKYFETGSKAGIQKRHMSRLRLQLAALDTSQRVEDMDVPGYRLHQLKGRVKNRWSIWVSGNWRLTFEFREGDVHVLDYEDYH